MSAKGYLPPKRYKPLLIAKIAVQPRKATRLAPSLPLKSHLLHLAVFVLLLCVWKSPRFSKNSTFPKTSHANLFIAVPLALDPSVVDRIMKSEGPYTIQSGKKEYYGFREDHPAFPGLHKLVREHGVESPQVKQRITELLNERAVKAGALLFDSPGVQASIMAISHLRGEGGCQAILNAVAGFAMVKSDKLKPESVDRINKMTKLEFQNKLRIVREAYDRRIYGDRSDSIMIKGTLVKGKWWTLFGNGLIKRYDRERQEFLGLA